MGLPPFRNISTKLLRLWISLTKFRMFFTVMVRKPRWPIVWPGLGPIWAKPEHLRTVTHGVWSITPEGRALPETEVANIPASVRSLYQEARKRGGDEEDVEASWKNELLEILQSIPPDSFERISQRILRESGFSKVEVRGKSGDGGIDGIGVLRINLLSFQVFFQCKRYKGTVSVGVIRDFRGANGWDAQIRGLLITTGRFTPDATREATRDGVPPIDLIDGDQLCDIL